MEEGTLISSENGFDETIYPILEGRQNQKRQNEEKERDQKYDDEEEEPIPKKKKKSKNQINNIFDDGYGFFISSILSAILGFLIFGNQSIIRFYGNFFSGFYEEGSEIISTRGRLIQMFLMAIMHWTITYWLL